MRSEAWRKPPSARPRESGDPAPGFPGEARLRASSTRYAREWAEREATVERREASVPRYGTRGASQAPGMPRHKRVHARLWRKMACPTGASQAPARLSALRPPSLRVSEAKLQTPDAKTRRGNEIGCLKSE